MTVKSLVKTSEYHDSVSLMVAARELTRLPGVLDAAVEKCYFAAFLPHGRSRFRIVRVTCVERRQNSLNGFERTGE